MSLSKVNFELVQHMLANSAMLIFFNFRAGHAGPPVPAQKILIGTREVVGYGVNGETNYIDSVMAPFPAIR